MVELSTLDSLLRKDIIKMSLDVEHFLKVKMLNHCSANKEENGYNIIDKYFRAFPDVKSEIENKSTTFVCKGLVDKFKDNWAIWNIVEVLTFKQFIDLYTMYFKFYSVHDSFINELTAIRLIRNAAAHNNCLINNLVISAVEMITPNREVTNAISKIPSIHEGQLERKMSNPIIDQFIGLLYVLNRVCSPKTITHTMQNLETLFTGRMLKHKNYFLKNQNIVSSYEFVRKIIDFYYKKSI